MDILMIVLVVVLVLILLGGAFPVANRWPRGYGYGMPLNAGLLMVILIIIVILFVR